MKKQNFISQRIIVALSLTLGLAVYFAIILSGVNCPIKWLFGISCPGCGMTRALVSLFEFDFALAFYYNPFIFVLGPAVALILVFYFKGKKQAYEISLWLLCAVLIAVYVVRLICGSDIVVFEPCSGYIFRLLFN